MYIVFLSHSTQLSGWELCYPTTTSLNVDHPPQVIIHNTLQVSIDTVPYVQVMGQMIDLIAGVLNLSRRGATFTLHCQFTGLRVKMRAIY
jgi:hypothetical protein